MRMLAAALATALALIGPAVPVATAQDTGCALGYEQRAVAVEPGVTPVLFVHGILSGPSTWDATLPSGQSLRGAVDAMPDAASYAFDYGDAALEWVEDRRIGPQLTETITCLARASGQKVVVVAHSMGGLATQFALGRIERPEDQVDLAITLGTPFTGSRLLSVAQAILKGTDVVPPAGGNPALAVALSAALTACAVQGRSGEAERAACWLGAVPESPVGDALRHRPEGRTQMLPSWPAAVPVLALSGDYDVPLPWGYVVPGSVGPRFRLPQLRVEPTVDVGDVVVTRESAADVGDRAEPLRCGPVDHREVALSECFHLNLQRSPTLAGSVLRAVRAAVEREPVDRVDWKNRMYTVRCKGISGGPLTVAVRGWSGTAPGDGAQSGYEIEVAAPAYGDLTGDGRPEAAVPIFCAPRDASPNFFTVELQVFSEDAVLLQAVPSPPARQPSDFDLAPRFRGEPRIDGNLLVDDVDRWVGADPSAAPSIQEPLALTWTGSEFVEAAG